MNTTLRKTSSAFFHCDLDRDFSSTDAPKYRRIDWKGVALPRRPSLKLIDDKFFFQLIGCDDLDHNKEKANRDLVPSGSNDSNLKGNRCSPEQECEMSSKKRTPIPLNVRKLEIELVQRKLPRYPSQTHLYNPSFYPLASCYIPKTRERKNKAPLIKPRCPSQTHLSKPSFYPLPSCHQHETRDRKKRVSLAEMNEDNRTTTEIENEYFKDKEGNDLSEMQKLTKEASLPQIDITTIEIEHECLEDKEDDDLPGIKELPYAQMAVVNSAINEILNECSEDEDNQDMNELTKKGTWAQVEKDNTATLEKIIECLEDEQDYGLPETQELIKETACLKVNKRNETDYECYEDKQDYDLPESNLLRKEESWAQTETENTTLLKIRNERLEDKEGHGLSLTQELTEKESSSHIEDSTTRTGSEIETEYYEDEEDYDLPRSQELIKDVSYIQTDEDDTTTTEIEIEHECSDDDEEYLDESYYSACSEDDSDYSEDEVDMAIDDIFEGLLNEMKVMHSENIEYIDHKLMNSSLRTDEDIEGVMSFSIGESSKIYIDESSRSYADDLSRSYTEESSFSSVASSPQSIVEDEPYEPKIGVVPPAVRAMIIQARFEFRGRKIPEEHRRKFKPSLTQASVVGQATRLDEHTVEACGSKIVKNDPSLLPSVVWVKGEETVSLPNFHDRSQTQFQIFKEAMALGSLKALKPKITTNYDRFLSTETSFDDEVDVDDTNRHKLIRIKYLTDIYLHQEHADRSRYMSIDEDSDLKPVQYENLDDVQLPTSNCPVYVCVKADITRSQLRDELAQQVAEAVWDRRYRLERPRAHQRIKYRCGCKYCKTSSPYQTRAYRKKWLIQQKLWKEPSLDDQIKEKDLENMKESSVADPITRKERKLMKEPPVDDSIIDMNLKVTKEQPGDDQIIETDLKKTSNRTANTRKTSIGEFSQFDLQMSSEIEFVESSVGISVNTVSSSDTILSDGFAIEEFEFKEMNTSMISESSEVVFDCKNSSVDLTGNSISTKKSIIIPADTDILESEKISADMDSNSSAPKISICIPARPRSEKKQKVNRKTAFIREIQSVLGLSQHDHRSSMQIEDCLKKRVEESKKVPKKSKNKRSITTGIKSMRSLFNNSSHNSESPFRNFARAA